MANYNAVKYDGFSKGSLTLIKTLTASSDGDLSFVDGSSSVVLDSTYKEYLFIFNNIHPATDGADFTFNMSADSGSNYNVTKTSTQFNARHSEDDGTAAMSYITGNDLAQGTGFQVIADGVGNGNDESGAGYLHIFNPSSTTFVKHFISNCNNINSNTYSLQEIVGGYFNDTNDIDAIQFKMSSGDIDAGNICLYGIA